MISISLSKIQDSLKALVGRFPVTMAFTVLMLINLYAFIPFDKDTFFVYSSYFLSMGMFISLLFELWKEEVPNKLPIWILLGVVICLALVDTVVLSLTIDNISYDKWIIARAAIFTALICGCLCISFLKNKNDIQLWNFSAKICMALFASFVVTMIMAVGIGFLVWGFEQLFSVDVEYETYLRILLPFIFLLPVSLFLIRIPLDDKHDDTVLVSKFCSGITRYLFIPMMICYMVVLYAYLLKIIFMWELPQGTVTWMVTIMMGGMIIIEVLLYPSVQQEVNNFNTKMAKLLPWLMLPLLMLMTVGISRRVSDYGITTDRLYVILVNIWYYVVCLYLIFTHNRRILWLPLSFCLLFLVSSAQPFSFVILPKYMRSYTISKIIEKHKPDTLPMNKAHFEQWMTNLSDKEKKSVVYGLEYLRTHYYRVDSTITEQWVDFYVFPHDFLDDDGYGRAVVTTSEIGPSKTFRFYFSDDNLTVPKGYTRVNYVTRTFYFNAEITENEKIETLFVCNSKNQFEITTTSNMKIVLDTAELRENFHKEMHIPTSNPNYIFIPTAIIYDEMSDRYRTLEMKGYFFGK